MAGRFNNMRQELERGWKMIDKCRTAVLIILAIAIVTGPAMAQTYSGAGAWTSSGNAGQVTGGGVSAGPGGVRTFSLGSGFMYSITSVSPNDALQLQNQGVRVVTVPAGKTLYVTSQTGQPLDIRTGEQGVMPKTIVFGPGGFVGTGVWAGPGTGAFAGTGPGAGTGVFMSPGGVSISAVPGAGEAYRSAEVPGQEASLRYRAGHRDNADVLVHRQSGRGISDYPAVWRQSRQGTVIFQNPPTLLFPPELPSSHA